MATNKQMLITITHELRDNGGHIAHIKKVIRNTLVNGFDINTKYLKGKTIAHYVVKYNVTGLMSFLSKQGLNLNICDDNYDSPLHFAVKKKRLWIIKELIQAGVDINIAGEFEATPLHLAVSEGYLDIAELLIEKGADISLVDERNLTALDYAVDENNEKMINLLNKKKGVLQ